MLSNTPKGITITSDDLMADVVNRNFNILPILSRLSIPLGFSHKTVREVCADAAIDTGVFLFIVNFLLYDDLSPIEPTIENAVGVTDFLQRSHDYFLNYKFPHIRTNLLDSFESCHADINPAIERFLDGYISQVWRHFSHENDVVFPYIKSLATDHPFDYSISIFRKAHEEINEKLSDLKNIILRYYTTSKPDRMYDVLVDIYNCEEDLDSHALIENQILIPMVEKIENSSQRHV